MQTARFSLSKNTLRLALLSALTMLPLHQVYACAACGCTLSKDWETQGISSKQGLIFDLSYDYLNQNRQWYGTGAASDALVQAQYAKGQEIEAYTRTQTLTAALTYNAEDWGVTVAVPHVMRDHGTYGGDSTNYPNLGSSYSTSADQWLGDIKVTGRFTGLSEDKSWGLIGGVKLPMGNIGTNFNSGTSAGTLLDAGLQIGSGSTDLIYGAYTTGGINNLGWFLQGTVQRAVSTSNAPGATDYRPGDAYTVNTGIRYASFGATVSPMLQLNIIKKLSDTGIITNGTSSVPTDPVTGAPVSGGTLAYLAPGVSVRLGGGASVYGFVQVPVYQNVSSLQITPSYTVTLGLRHSFE